MCVPAPSARGTQHGAYVRDLNKGHDRISQKMQRRHAAGHRQRGELLLWADSTSIPAPGEASRSCTAVDRLGKTVFTFKKEVWTLFIRLASPMCREQTQTFYDVHQETPRCTDPATGLRWHPDPSQCDYEYITHIFLCLSFHICNIGSVLSTLRVTVKVKGRESVRKARSSLPSK